MSFRWYTRIFAVISNEKAKQMGLMFYRNVYGDEINQLNCRSVWVDDKNRQYRVENLHEIKPLEGNHEDIIYLQK